ncbi:putative membrane protein, partial [Vibrio parahaemolyticus V-223/04]
ALGFAFLSVSQCGLLV